ncbi:MAG: hypothetical protein HYU39_00770 [Thaumarchaeota archaeon]|nr:hypothetical protein [Nitrososphaerota archaeon]
MEPEDVLKVKFLGLELKNPLVAEAAGYSVSDWGIKRLLKSGLAAVITKSTTWDPMGDWPRRWEATPQPRCYWVYDDEKRTLDGTEALQNPGYKNMAKFIKECKPLADKLNAHIIGSLSARSPEEAATIAREFEKAGAAAIHMDLVCGSAGPFRNLQYPGMGYERLGSYWSQSPERLHEVIKAVRDAVDIPLCPKTFAYRWVRSNPDAVPKVESTGLDGHALQSAEPTLDVNLYTGRPVYSKVSGQYCKFMTYYILADMARVAKKDLLPSGGIHGADDVVKCFMLGASAVGLCTALYRDIDCVQQICKDLESYMVDQTLDSLEQIKGYSLRFLPPKPAPMPLRAELEAQARELGKAFKKPQEPQVTVEQRST